LGSSGISEVDMHNYAVVSENMTPILA